MTRLTSRIVQFASRHLGLTITVLVIAVGAGAVLLSPTLRARAEGVSQRALAWAGLAGAAEESGETYWCPMHPQIKRNNPNEVCPICNMALVKLEGEANAEAPEHLTLTERQIQQAGVVLQPVVRRRLYREIDTTGRIDYDETRLKTITSWVRDKSRIQDLFVNFTYEEVKKGQVLAKLYSEELIIAQRDYLRALEMRSRLGDIDLVGESEQRLRDQGMTPEQIQKLKTTRRPQDYVPVYATMSGTVIKRYVQQGSYVDKGDPLFEIADLSQVWLFADIYEEEYPLVQAGKLATVTVRSLPGRTFQGEVEYIDRVLNPQTRTVRVRIRVENVPSSGPTEGSDVAEPNAKRLMASTADEPIVPAPDRPSNSGGSGGVNGSTALPENDWGLVPGMYARVQLRHEAGEHLAVPEDAVLWSGQRRVVLVREGSETFRPKEVRLGTRWLYPVMDDKARGQRPAGSEGDESRSLADEFAKSGLEFGAHRKRYHVVLDGLAPGDQVVTAGAFLLNAESQFQSVLTKMLPPEDQAATLEEAVGEAVAGRIGEMLYAYFDLSAALAADDLKAVPIHSESLARAAEGLADQAARQNMDELAAAARDLIPAARKLTAKDSTEPKVARTRFGAISHDLIQLLANHGGKTLFEREVYLFECGMAKVGYEKWLWRTPQIHNPYMGQKMLTCGTKLKTLEP